jgi:hypothetical protein
MSDQATATLPREEQSTPEIRKFASPYPELRLVMQPADDIPVDNRGHTRRVPGRYIYFRDGYYQTSDPDEIEFLVNHVNKDRLFRDITEIAPKPDAAPMLNRIVELTGLRDTEALIELLDGERRGEQREDVLDACERALEILERTSGTDQESVAPTGALSAAAASLPVAPGQTSASAEDGVAGPAGHASERPRSTED